MNITCTSLYKTWWNLVKGYKFIVLNAVRHFTSMQGWSSMTSDWSNLTKHWYFSPQLWSLFASRIRKLTQMAESNWMQLAGEELMKRLDQVQSLKRYVRTSELWWPEACALGENRPEKSTRKIAHSATCPPRYMHIGTLAHKGVCTFCRCTLGSLQNRALHTTWEHCFWVRGSWA